MSYARPPLLEGVPAPAGPWVRRRRRRGLLGLLGGLTPIDTLGDPDAPPGFFDPYYALVAAAAAARAAAGPTPGWTPPEGASKADVAELVAAAQQGVFVSNAAGTSDEIEAAARAQQVKNQVANTGSRYGVDASGHQVTNAEGDASLRADARAVAQAFVDSAVAKGAVFTDTIKPGDLYDESFLTGMISTTQLVDDMVNLKFGGAATNTAAAAGKVSPKVAANVVTAATLVTPKSGDESANIDPAAAALEVRSGLLAATGLSSKTFAIGSAVLLGGLALARANKKRGRR